MKYGHEKAVDKLKPASAPKPAPPVKRQKEALRKSMAY